MARKPEIQYIQYYIDGTAARKPEPQTPQRSRKPLPRPKSRTRYVVKVQPLAVLGIVLSVVLLCMMISGIFDFMEARQQMQQMQERVISQRQENAVLRQTYEDNINLEEIQKAALALGMVPEAEVAHITISVPKPEPADDTGFMLELTAFLAALAA